MKVSTAWNAAGSGDVGRSWRLRGIMGLRTGRRVAAGATSSVLCLGFIPKNGLLCQPRPQGSLDRPERAWHLPPPRAALFFVRIEATWSLWSSLQQAVGSLLTICSLALPALSHSASTFSELPVNNPLSSLTCSLNAWESGLRAMVGCKLGVMSEGEEGVTD